MGGTPARPERTDTRLSQMCRTRSPTGPEPRQRGTPAATEVSSARLKGNEKARYGVSPEKAGTSRECRRQGPPATVWRKLEAMKRMLINATHAEELRVALVDGQRLYDLDIENRNRISTKSNIYKGRITRVEPSLEAAFVDFGAERHGFLPLKEIAREYFAGGADDGQSRLKIRDLVREGQEIVVQVEKEERGSKGAALTTFISLAGRYMVLMPNNPRAGGISRRIEGDERIELRDALESLKLPEGMGVIIRTAGVGRSAEELQWDLDYLLHLWSSIAATADRRAPFLIFQESNVVIRAIRDYLRQDIDEVLIDSKDSLDKALEFIDLVMPNYRSRVKLYQDSMPLFNRYQIESQIETAFQREVKLPSGGAIVIDPTEAMVAIDINSARATKGSDIEETALQTNLEAADEIARQLRLRDMGGLIVIDFIDMSSARNQKEVENRLRTALEPDRARIQTGRISRFGLMEMSRQRLRPSLEETSSVVCPRCSGQGSIRDTKSLALSVLRLMQEEAGKDRSAQIRAIVPVDIASYLLNEKRRAIIEMEQRNRIRVLIIPNPNMETPHFEVQRLRDDNTLLQTDEDSFALIPLPPEPMDPAALAAPPAKLPVAAVQGISPMKPAPQPAAAPAPAPAPAQAPVEIAVQAKKPGIVGSLLRRLFGGGTSSEVIAEPQQQPIEASETESPRRDEGGERRGRRGRRGGSRSRSGSGSQEAQGDRAEGADRMERAPNQERGERTPRNERGARGERGAERPPREDRPAREERAARDERPAREERPERAERGRGRDRSGAAEADAPSRRPSDVRPPSRAPRRRGEASEQSPQIVDAAEADRDEDLGVLPAQLSEENQTDQTPDNGTEAERTGRRRRRGRGRRRSGERTETESSESDSDSDQIELLDETGDEQDQEESVASPRVLPETNQEPDEALAEGQEPEQAHSEQSDEGAYTEEAQAPIAVATQPAVQRPAPTPQAPAPRVVMVAAAAVPSPLPRERVVGRVTNDPRISPRPVQELEIITESLVIDPSSFPPVQIPESTRARPPRSANDPRIGRAPRIAEEPVSEAAETP